MPDSEAENENPNHQQHHYILHIKEHLATSWSKEFEGLAVTYTPTGETLLTGFIPDQAGLHGLLARIRDLNLTLISVNRNYYTPTRFGLAGIFTEEIPRLNRDQTPKANLEE